MWRVGKIGRPSYSHGTTLSYTQLLFRIGKIGCKALLLLWYNAVINSIALQSRGNWWQGLPALTVQRCCTVNYSVDMRKLVAKSIWNYCSHLTMLFYTQLLFEVGEISGKAYQLSWYNVVIYSTTLQGKRNWLQSLLALMVWQSYILNYCRGSGKLESPLTLMIQCYCILNYFEKLEKSVARPTCSHCTMLLHTQLTTFWDRANW